MDAHQRSSDIFHAFFTIMDLLAELGYCTYLPHLPTLWSHVEWIPRSLRSLIVLWYHLILNAHHACRPGIFMAYAIIDKMYLARSTTSVPLLANSASSVSTFWTRWQLSSSPKPMATASSAASRCSSAESFSSPLGSKNATSPKTLSSRRCSWLLIARSGRG